MSPVDAGSINYISIFYSLGLCLFRYGADGGFALELGAVVDDEGVVVAERRTRGFVEPRRTRRISSRRLVFWPVNAESPKNDRARGLESGAAEICPIVFLLRLGCSGGLAGERPLACLRLHQLFF